MPFSILDLPGKQFRKSMSDSPPLRIGLRVDGPTMPAWSAAVVQDLLLSDYIQIVDVKVVPHRPWWSESFRGALAHLLFRALDGLYRLENDPMTRCRVPPSLADRQSDEPLDVCLDLSGLDKSWTREARHGTWRLQLGNPTPNGSWPPYGREMLQDESMRRVELQCSMDPDSVPQILCRADFPSDPFPSARSNLIGPLWGGSHFFLQKLNELHRHGTVALDPCAAMDAPVSALKDVGVRDLLRWISRQVSRRVSRVLGSVSARPVWRIAIRRTGIPLPDAPTDEALASFRWMDELSVDSAADPFLFENEGKLWLFFESIDSQTGHGHIACGWIDESGRLRDECSALKIATHLSYPHLVRDGNEIYLLPESAESGGLDLYRARSFPVVWEKVGRLLDFPCVDSTVFRRDGAWWMFTSPMATSGAVALTWLFKAERVEGPWEYQFSGPVSCSALTARAAGKVFELDGRLVRPSQDCGRSYGRAMVFNEVTSLDGDRYAEHTFCRVESKPFPGLVGLHTYNRLRDWEVIDGLFSDRFSSGS